MLEGDTERRKNAAIYRQQSQFKDGLDMASKNGRFDVPVDCRFLYAFRIRKFGHALVGHERKWVLILNQLIQDRTGSGGAE